MKSLSSHTYVLVIILLALISMPCGAVTQQEDSDSKQLLATLKSMRDSLPKEEFLQWLIDQGADSESKNDPILAWCHYSYYREFARGYKLIELMVH